MKTELKVTSIKFPTEMLKKLQAAIIEQGYGMHGKSRWINEAIEQFLVLPDFQQLVEIAEDMDNLKERVVFRLNASLQNQLDAAVLAIRKELPLMEGVQSHIIRASILQKLIRKT